MQTIADVMTETPRTLSTDDSILDAARLMREEDIGDVLVVQDGECAGIVTDRDIVVRAIAEGRTPDSTKLGDVASREIVTIAPGDPLDRAIAIMRDKAIRRLPVCNEQGEPVGVVSLGDLAEARDPNSVLGEVSSAPPNE